MEGRIYCKGCLAQGNRAPSSAPSGTSKTLRRSNQEKLVAGVCGGIARTYDYDVSLVRLIVVIGAIFTAIFPFVIAYIILWAAVPAED